MRRIGILKVEFSNEIRRGHSSTISSSEAGYRFARDEGRGKEPLCIRSTQVSRLLPTNYSHQMESRIKEPSESTELKDEMCHTEDIPRVST